MALIPKPKKKPVMHYKSGALYKEIKDDIGKLIYHTDGNILLDAREVEADIKKATICKDIITLEAAQKVFKSAETCTKLLIDEQEEIKIDLGTVHKFSAEDLDIFLQKDYVFSPKLKIYADKTDSPLRIELEGKVIGVVASVLLPALTQMNMKSAEALLYE